MNNLEWWKTCIIYQIYPRSFMDSNNDGIGDLKGIENKLDYLKKIGVDAIWISPFYPSPMHDFGYDISDYKGIHQIFGTMNDFEDLLSKSHKLGIKLIIDFVPNHTSDEHPWFVESRKSKNNPFRDFYIWRDPAPDGGPPNNWLSYFGGSAWEYDDQTKQYYLHQFVKQQPDLNYQNSKVLEEMLSVLDFWLAKGVDGIRVDVICNMWKNPEFPNEKLNRRWNGKFPYERFERKYSSNTREVHDIIRRFREVLNRYSDRVMIGETYLPFRELIKYYGKNGDECHLPFNFHLLTTPWKASAVREVVDHFEDMLPNGCCPSYVLGNHDRQRLVTKVKSEEQSRVALFMLLTLRGTPTVYYGEEIGMKNVKIPLNMIQDPPALNMPEIADDVGRDPVRTPMQWSASSNAGFSAKGVKTWLPIDDDYKKINAEILFADSASILNMFSKLVKLRKKYQALNSGDYVSLKSISKNIYAYLRTYGTERFLIVLNFSKKSSMINFEEILNLSRGEILLSANMLESGMVDLSSLIVEGDNGFLIKL